MVNQKRLVAALCGPVVFTFLVAGVNAAHAQAVPPQGVWDQMTWDEDVWAFDPNTDSDNDGLFDEDEYELYRTNPFNADTDSDGIVDGAEVNFFGTNPLSADTDGDGLTDAKEMEIGTSPTAVTSNTQLQAALSALGEAVYKQVSVMPLPLLAAFAALVGWLALRRRQSE